MIVRMLPIASIVTWLDAHQGATTAFLTLALVVVTIYYAAQNAFMVGEMRRTRELSIENREAEEHRERLRDIREITDQATWALQDLWGSLAAFSYAIPRGDPPVSRQSPIESTPPDPDRFLDAYSRLRQAHIRLLNRVEWGDTFHSPVGRAVIDAQTAFNPVVNEDPYGPRERRSENAILHAIGTTQHSLRELQETSRQRFAPLGLPDSRFSVVHVLTVIRRGERANELIASLRSEPERHARVTGPDKSGRLVIRDDEAEPGEAHRRLLVSLDASGDDWRDFLQLAEPRDSNPGD